MRGDKERRRECVTGGCAADWKTNETMANDVSASTVFASSSATTQSTAPRVVPAYALKVNKLSSALATATNVSQNVYGHPPSVPLT